MTAYKLQKELAEEIKAILKTMLFHNRQDEQTNIITYLQKLPQDVPDAAADMSAYYPYCVIRVDSGRMETSQSAHEIKTVLEFGIFDHDTSCQGHQAILNSFQKIAERFTKNPVLNQTYRINEKAGIKWHLLHEDTYPYYYGAMELVWDAASARREDSYA